MRHPPKVAYSRPTPSIDATCRKNVGNQVFFNIRLAHCQCELSVVFLGRLDPARGRPPTKHVRLSPSECSCYRTPVRRIVTIIIGALLMLSHGGLVAAHSHMPQSTGAHTATTTAHVDDHHVDTGDKGEVALDQDEPDFDGEKSPSSPSSHSHVAVDGVARTPVPRFVPASVKLVRHAGRRHLEPSSAVVAPGLEPPTA